MCTATSWTSTPRFPMMVLDVMSFSREDCWLQGCTILGHPQVSFLLACSFWILSVALDAEILVSVYNCKYLQECGRRTSMVHGHRDRIPGVHTGHGQPFFASFTFCFMISSVVVCNPTHTLQGNYNAIATNTAASTLWVTKTLPPSIIKYLRYSCRATKIYQNATIHAVIVNPRVADDDVNCCNCIRNLIECSMMVVADFSLMLNNGWSWQC